MYQFWGHAMFRLLRSATFLAALLFAEFASADDTIRLVGRSADTKRLDLKASDSKEDTTEKTCWFRGGYEYVSYYYGPSIRYYAAPVHPIYAPPVRVYRPVPLFYRPVPALYRVPRAVFVSPPIVSYRVVTPIAATQIELQSTEPEPQSFDYDGGPAKPVQKIPPARLEEPAAIPTLPKLPGVPKLGPSPAEFKISEPAPAAQKKYAYPAYGEDRTPARGSRALLIRATR